MRRCLSGVSALGSMVFVPCLPFVAGESIRVRARSRTLWMAARLVAVAVGMAAGSVACVEPNQRMTRSSESVEDREHHAAVLRVGAASRHLGKCEVAEARQDVERAVTF